MGGSVAKMRYEILLPLYLYQIASALDDCNTELLKLPNNGKAWNYIEKKRRWELECEENYEVERVSARDLHRCKSENEWASPSKVVVKCRFSSEAVYEEIKVLEHMEKKIIEIAEEISKNAPILKDTNQMVAEMTNSQFNSTG